MRAKKHVDPVVKEYLVINDDATPHRKLCRSRWAALIKKEYEVDPLICTNPAWCALFWHGVAWHGVAWHDSPP